MPRKPGVSKVRVTASRANSGGSGAPWAVPWGGSLIRRLSQRMRDMIELLFDISKHLFVADGCGGAVVAARGGREHGRVAASAGSKNGREQTKNDWITLPPRGIVREFPTGARNAEVWRYGAVDGRAAHARRD